MATEGPLLDRRRFADLMTEAEAIIRRRAPGWTDLSPGDPGITLVEVFAYLTEILFYRLNRVPDQVHLRLLDLLGVTAMAPAAATVTLTFTRDDEASGGPVRIPAGTRVADSGGSVVFSTLADIMVETAPVDVEAVHAELIRAEAMGVGTGEAGQGYRVRKPPIIRNTGVPWALAVGVETSEPADRSATIVEEAGKAFLMWREVSSFIDLGEGERAYLADRATGKITFAPSGGNGGSRLGPAASIPPAGGEIRAWYRTGGGRNGNVAPGRLTTIVDRIGGVSVTNKARAVGGEDGETLEAVVARGREAVRVLRTAVTARDFERLAQESGGVARARAMALREVWPFAAPGIVDLEIVPRMEPEVLVDGAVTPDVLAAHNRPELLDRVKAHVGARQPLGVETRVSVTKCRPVSISGRVVVSRAESPARVRTRLLHRLNDLLSPQGTWPHGKILRASDVFNALLSEPGVRYAERIRFTIDVAPGRGVRTLVRDPHMPRAVFAGTTDGLFRSLELGRGWELLETSPEDRNVGLVAPHREVPGLLAAVAEAPGGLQRLLVSEDVGETWRRIEQIENEPVYDIAWVASRVGRPVLFIATRKALRRYELGVGGGSTNIQELTGNGAPGGNGFFAVAAARHPMDVSCVAIAARELGGVLISRAGGAKRSFEPIPGSSGKDIRSLVFQPVGDRLFLWAGISAAAGAEGEGAMRVEARADGIDPAGWTSFSKGWRGGSCEGLDVNGNVVVAGSNRAGVLTMDLSAPNPSWTAAPLDSGLPINNDRNALLPIDTVAAVSGETRPTLVAGAEGGVFVAADGVHYVPDGLTSFTEQVPLPRSWLYCSGPHELDVVTDAESVEAPK